MTDDRKKEILFDTLIKLSVSEALEKEISSLPSIEGLNQEYEPSQALDKRINSIISKGCRRFKIKWFSKKLRKIAAFICILFTMSSVVLLSVCATRNAILNAVIQLQKKYAEAKFVGSATSATYQQLICPKDFVKVQVKKFGNTVIVTYSNKDGKEILFSQWGYNKGVSLVDNENTNYMETEISGEKAHLFKAQTEEDSNTLIWQSKGIVFELTPKISSDELYLQAFI